MKEKKPNNIIKTEKAFQRNYSLHDRAETEGLKVLNSHGRFKIENFGEDRRYEDVWEAGEDKPDIKIIFENKVICLLDWKGKYSDWICVNERAYNSYDRISKSLNVPIVIAMARFQKQTNNLISFQYFILPDDNLVSKKTKSWDGNIVNHFFPNKGKNFNKIDYFLDLLIK